MKKITSILLLFGIFKKTFSEDKFAIIPLDFITLSNFSQLSFCLLQYTDPQIKIDFASFLTSIAIQQNTQNSTKLKIQIFLYGFYFQDINQPMFTLNGQTFFPISTPEPVQFEWDNETPLDFNFSGFSNNLIVGFDAISSFFIKIKFDTSIFTAKIIPETLPIIINYNPSKIFFINQTSFSQTCIHLVFDNLLCDYLPKDVTVKVQSPFYNHNNQINTQFNAFSNTNQNNVSFIDQLWDGSGITSSINGNTLTINGGFENYTSSANVLALNICNITAPSNVKPETFDFIFSYNNYVFTNFSVDFKSNLPFSFEVQNQPIFVFTTNFSGNISFSIHLQNQVSFSPKMLLLFNFTTVFENMKGLNFTFQSLDDKSYKHFINISLNNLGVFTCNLDQLLGNFKSGLLISINFPIITQIGVFTPTLQLIDSISNIEMSQKTAFPFSVIKNLTHPFIATPLNPILNQPTHFLIEAIINTNSPLFVNGIDMSIQFQQNLKLSDFLSNLTLYQNFPFLYSSAIYDQNTGKILISNMTFINFPNIGAYFSFEVGSFINSPERINDLTIEVVFSSQNTSIWTHKAFYKLSQINITLNSTNFTIGNQFDIEINFSINSPVNFNHFFTISIPPVFKLSNFSNWIIDSSLLTTNTSFPNVFFFNDQSQNQNLVIPNLLFFSVPEKLNRINLKGVLNSSIIPYVDFFYFNIFSSNFVLNSTFDFSTFLSLNKTIPLLLFGCPNACRECITSTSNPMLCRSCWNTNFYLSRNQSLCLTILENPLPLNPQSNTTNNSLFFNSTVLTLPLPKILQKIYISATYSTFVLGIIFSLGFFIFFRENFNIFSFGTAFFNLEQLFLNVILLVQNVLQWKTLGLVYSIPNFGLFLGNFLAVIILVLEFNIVIRFRWSLKKQICLKKSLSILICGFFGSGLFLLRYSFDHQLEIEDETKIQLNKHEMISLIKFQMVVLILMVVNSVSAITIYFIYLGNSLHLNCLILFNLAVEVVFLFGFLAKTPIDKNVSKFETASNAADFKALIPTSRRYEEINELFDDERLNTSDFVGDINKNVLENLESSP